VPIFDIAINNEYEGAARAARSSRKGHDGASDGPAPMTLRSRIFNLTEQERRRMRDLDPTDIDTLVSLKGMVIRTSPLIPDLRRAFFQCARCGQGEDVDVDRGRIDEPSVCAGCGQKYTMELKHNRCIFANKQLVKLQVRARARGASG
jgi:DNA replication licensing factor MCM4